MSLRCATLLASFVLVACGPSDQGYYLRFEPVFDSDFSSGGSVRSFIWDESIVVTGSSGTTVVSEGGTRSLSEYAWLTPKGSSAFALRQGVVRTDDLQTFTQVSSESFLLLGAVGERLVAVRKSGTLGTASVWVSDDDAVTWRTVGDIDAGDTFGTGESFSLGSAWKGRLRLIAGVSDDTFGNVNAVSQTWELQGDALTVVGRLGGQSPLVAPPFPRFEGPDGLGLFEVSSGAHTIADLTAYAVSRDAPASQDALETLPRLRWASPLLLDAALPPSAFGVDAQGRLWMAAYGKVVRSVLPFRADSDQRADILRGAGCDTRTSFTPDLANDESVDVTFENQLGREVLLRHIDNQHRWHTLATVPAGGSLKVRSVSSNASRENARLMVSDVTDDTCLGVHVVGSAETSTVTAR